MNLRHWMVLAGLGLLIVLTVAGLVWTEPGRNTTMGLKGAPQGQQGNLVDQRPLQTARKLAAMASTSEEQAIGHEILVNADHEVDLAFAEELRNAQEHPVKPTAEIQALENRINDTQAAVKADQGRVDGLKKELAAASENNKDALEQRLDLAQAQAVMDQDELDDAKEDLSRAGGDKESKIRRLLDEHEASDHEGDSLRSATPAWSADVDYAAGNLASQARAWNALREKQAQLAQARQEAQAAITELTARRQLLAQTTKQEGFAKHAAAQQAAGLIQSSRESGAAVAREDAAATMASLRRFSQHQKALFDTDKRIQDEQEIADGYGNWIGLLQNRQRTALHGILRSLLWIVVIVFALYGFGRVVDRYFRELTPDKKRLLSARVVVRFLLQAAGVLLILFVIFGAPTETPTILGLAGAGLTVALKDFIVSFFGWFVLMGKDGIRVGDWVEINGVGGEVVEIGLLRTILLETGSWSDSGHPTGRRVAFVNSYAVEGHYFNFSTSGQWSWDEIQVLVPAGDNPYSIIDDVQKLVLSETHASTDLAGQEWQKTTSRYRVQSFSVVPSVNLRPTGGGIEVVVRYVVRAHERYEVRSRLYKAIVDLLQKHGSEQATSKKLSQGA